MIKQALIALISALIAAFYFKDTIFNFTENKKLPNLFSPAELALFNGVDKVELYLAILGNVFDVSKGAKHYGKGQQYNGFIGRDASRSFVTGKFEKPDLTDDVSGFTEPDFRSLNHWLQFYKKEYRNVGKLIGRYYNKKGKVTPYGKEIKKLIKQAENAKRNEDLDKVQFPPCNVEWDPEQGTRVWCTDRSDGIARNWIGVPRQLFEAGSDNSRCACIHDSNENQGNIKPYDNCALDAQSCYIKS